MKKLALTLLTVLFAYAAGQYFWWLWTLPETLMELLWLFLK